MLLLYYGHLAPLLWSWPSTWRLLPAPHVVPGDTANHLDREDAPSWRSCSISNNVCGLQIPPHASSALEKEKNEQESARKDEHG